ncbi:glucosyltransferase domain-containing protein [Enterobacter ludwigii]|uniref:glucosyltransferase domain-containing protein n=1 Tax=Enterobacter ludwigii TaxID=299767 RepID=UPI002FD40473
MSHRNKLFAFLMGMSLLYVLPVILADRPYIDDLGRSVLGYTWWGLNGRPLSDMVMIALSMGSPILDLSPLPMLLGISVMSLALAAYMDKAMHDRSAKEKLLVCFCFLANPFLLECLSYKFDSLTMLLSAAILFIPFTTQARASLAWIVTVICLISSLSLYQASIGIFVILTFLECAFFVSSNKEIIKSALSRAIQFGLGYVLYTKIVLPLSSGGDYVKNHSEFISLSNPDELLQNIDGIANIVRAYLESIPKFVIYLYALMAVACLALMLIDAIRSKQTVKAIIVISMPFAAALFSVVHILLLKDAVIAPRVFISASAFLLMNAMIICKGISGFRFSYTLLVPFIFCSFSLSYAYGNALKQQKMMDENLISSLSYDINNIDKKPSNISFIGVAPSAPQRDLAIKRMPIIKYLTPIYMRGDWVWGAKLLAYNGLNLTLTPINGKAELCNVVKRNGRYSIIESGDWVIISFDPKVCK